MRAKILFVEDEESMRVFLGDRLQSEGYATEFASDGIEGLEKASSAAYDLILLDLMLPGVDGFEICRRIRMRGMATPILILTARSQTEDKVKGLKTGADDYVTKPFEVSELLARIEVLLRRTLPHPARAYAIGHLTIDIAGTSVAMNGEPIALSAREFQLLRYLIEHRGETLTREELLREVWGYSAEAFTRTVDVHIASIRTKLKFDPTSAGLIQTIKGIGYKFIP